MNAIDDMQNEKDFYDYYNEFEYDHDFESDDDTLLYKTHLYKYVY